MAARTCTEPGCGYTTKMSAHLARHMRTHTGERPFECLAPGCGYSAAHSGSLKVHMRLHAVATLRA